MSSWLSSCLSVQLCTYEKQGQRKIRKFSILYFNIHRTRPINCYVIIPNVQSPRHELNVQNTDVIVTNTPNTHRVDM